MRRRAAGLALLLTTVALAAMAGLAGAQDVIWKNDGGKLRGRIIREGRAGVTIETPGGTYTVPHDQIARLEREADVFRELEDRRAKLRASDLAGWLELGTWAQNQGLYPQAIDCFHEVLRIEPDHADARWELGYRRHEGKWLTEGEYFEARGYVRWEDRWVSRDEHDKLEQGLVYRDGRWVQRGAGDDQPAVAPTPATPQAGAARPGGPTAGPGAPAAGPVRRTPPNPWGAGPLGGQVGLPPLSEAERAAQLERERTAGGWKVAFSSRYYDVYSNGPLEDVKTCARTMDLVCEEFKKIFQFTDEITRPFPIHLYASQQDFMARTGNGPGVGGFYDGKKIVAYLGKQGGLQGTLSTLFHEGTHQFQGLVLGRNMWKAKIWLIEGLAVFFEATDVQGKRVSTGAIPKDRLAHVKRAITSGGHVKLRDLIRMEQAQFGALHYAHAWSLIYFLVNGTQGGKKRFVEYWERTKVGVDDPVGLFEELFDRPMEEIEAAWKAYVTRLG